VSGRDFSQVVNDVTAARGFRFPTQLQGRLEHLLDMVQVFEALGGVGKPFFYEGLHF